MYAIKRMADGSYAAPKESRHGFVSLLRDAAMYRTEEEARAEVCAGEKVIEVGMAVTPKMDG